MDKANEVGNRPQSISAALHQEAVDASYRPPTILTKIENKLSELEGVAVAGAGFAIGVAARLPGEVGIVGKIAAAGLGGLAAYDAYCHSTGASLDDNRGAFIRDGAFLTSLTAGLVLGPRLLSGEAIPAARSLPTMLAEDLTRQNAIFHPEIASRAILDLDSAASTGVGQSKIVDIGTLSGNQGQGAIRMIEDSEIGRFPTEQQAAIRQTISAMVERGHSARHLILSEDGTVLLDRDAIDQEHLIQALKGLTKEK